MKAHSHCVAYGIPPLPEMQVAEPHSTPEAFKEIGIILN